MSTEPTTGRTAGERCLGAVLLLALGAFAVGTDSYIISGILPAIAGEFRLPEGVTGQLVTVFALSYAISAPVLTTLTAAFGRRLLLQTALGVFLLANVLGAFAPTYGVLLVARVLAGAGAAMYMNTAVAVATAVAGDSRRGRAVSLVLGGLTLATAFGVPLGSLVGNLGSWRGTLGLTAALAAVAMAGLALTLPATAAPPAVSMGRRLRVAARPGVLVAVTANTLVVGGSFVVFTYLAVLTRAVTPLSEAGISAVLLVWGVAAAAGNAAGGRSCDRRGSERTYLYGVGGVAASFVALGTVALAAPRGNTATTAVFLLCTLVWSGLYWLIPGAQVQRVMLRAPDAPVVAVSVSSASSYLGVALGGAVGGATLQYASAQALPWTGCALVLCALLVVVRDRYQAPEALPDATKEPSGSTVRETLDT
ncbi:MFS transporter [Streptomyces sp. NBC_00566]|uniref:MFS transporter n=1 Tax=Streptomyces sp. NBC_00566 TaxID=2975778 RepID=UPI002E802365|nr:MFS transporter [Streptomyces sp. NBC_00566]WUB87074.1 MFS transporter [Streptomyces sp. NBC_00566]